MADRSVGEVGTMVERRRYRKVSTRMWGDEKFRELSTPPPNGQSLWVYLITGPHTTAVPGLFSAGEAQLAEALGWPLSGFRKAWREVEAQGMCRADWKARVVWLPNALPHNVPESPNVVTGWKVAVDELPTCTLKREALAAMLMFLFTVGKTDAFGKAFLEALPKGFVEDFGEGSRDPLANQEQEQEQEEYPPTPHADARGAARVTRALRKRAEEILRIRFGRCVHEPACANHEACVLTTATELQAARTA